MTNPIYVDADGDGEIAPQARIPGVDDANGQARTARPTPTVGGTRRIVTVPTEREAREEEERAMYEAIPLKRKVALRRLPRWLWPSNDPRDIRRVLVQFVGHAH
jgi:hypothetical protein